MFSVFAWSMLFYYLLWIIYEVPVDISVWEYVDQVTLWLHISAFKIFLFSRFSQKYSATCCMSVLAGTAQKLQHDIKPFVQLLYNIASYGEVSLTATIICSQN